MSASAAERLIFVKNIIEEKDKGKAIDFVTALEEELADRTVGFRIDDEDLEDLKTVRDAVDYVFAKLEAG